MNGRIRLNAVGDVMLGDFPLTLGFGTRSSILKRRGSSPFEQIRHVLRDSDICFGNLEAVLSDHGLKKRDIRSVQMRGAPGFAELLRDAGFNAMSLANNHAMQHGPEAFSDTQQRLAAVGIAPVGIAVDEGKVLPCRFEAKGVRVCFLGYSLRPEKYSSRVLYARGNVSDIAADIQSCRPDCDVLVVSLHWGDEFVQVPSLEQIEAAHALVDAGAGLIIGHHSHVLQGIESYKRGVIAYSLGNFVFDFWQRKMRRSVILHCELSRNGVESYGLTPVFIDESFRPRAVWGEDGLRMMKKMDSLSHRIRTVYMDEGRNGNYALKVRGGLLVNKLQNRLFFLRNIFRYDAWVRAQSCSNFFRVRFRG